MPAPSDPNQDKIILLSQVHAHRRGDELIETSESKIEEIFEKVITRQVSKNFEDLQQKNEHISLKIECLQNSIDRMVSQFTAIKNGETDDPALRVTTDMDKTDIALASVQLYQEDYYIYTTKDISDTLGIKSVNKVSKLSSSLGLRGNSQYHKAIKTGENKAGKINSVQKYSQAAFDKIKEEIQRENGLT